MARHKHADVIIAWANGATIEYKDGHAWWNIDHPDWAEDVEYRAKQRWCESIPEQGRLCWVRDSEKAAGLLRLVVSVDFSSNFPFQAIASGRWRYAQPLTNDEIRTFLVDDEVPVPPGEE